MGKFYDGEFLAMGNDYMVDIDNIDAHCGDSLPHEQGQKGELWDGEVQSSVQIDQGSSEPAQSCRSRRANSSRRKSKPF